MRLDHVARFIVNANHNIVRPAEKLSVIDRVADCVWFGIPQATEWKPSTPRLSLRGRTS
jgi:hypothetical protein